jgi:hypothetical protein
LIFGAVIKRLGGFHVCKADDHASRPRGAFHDFYLAATGQKFAAVFGDGGSGEGRIFRVSIGVFHIDLDDGIGWQGGSPFAF